MRDTNYGVWLDTSVSPSEFRDWAWSDMNIGWISFNCADRGICGTSNYKVFTSLVVNQPPSASNLQATQPDYCIITWPSAIFSWQFTDPDGDSQSAYQVQVDDDINFPPPFVVDSEKVISSSNSYATLPGKLSWNTTYYWRLKVWDSKDASSTWIEYNDPTDPDGDGNPKTFTTPEHSYPSPNFFPSPQNPAIAEIVTFNDSSKCYSSPGNAEYSCSAGGSISYLWDFDNGQTSTKKGNATTTYTTTGSKTVRLTITDNSLTPAGSCDTTMPVNASLPLPDWIEIPPF